VTSASHDSALAWHPVLSSSSSLLSSLDRRTYTPNTADSAPRTPATGRDRGASVKLKLLDLVQGLDLRLLT
jgi:hypothetical protein